MAEPKENEEFIPKLNSTYYHEWKRDIRMVLLIKDLWNQLHEEIAPAERVAERSAWKRAQQRALAVIHLNCERDQKRLIADAENGIEAWDTLAQRYASSDMAHVMRIEERFGQVRKKKGQTIEQWVTQVKELANLLREMGQEVPAERVAHRIITEVGKEYEAVKVAVRARRGVLTVDWVEQQLLANEVEKNEDDDGTLQ